MNAHPSQSSKYNKIKAESKQNGEDITSSLDQGFDSNEQNTNEIGIGISGDSIEDGVLTSVKHGLSQDSIGFVNGDNDSHVDDGVNEQEDDRIDSDQFNLNLDSELNDNGQYENVQVLDTEENFTENRVDNNQNYHNIYLQTQ